MNNKKKKLNKLKINNVFKNIYGKEKGIIELTLKDFIYNKQNEKIYINNKYFSEKKGIIIFYAPWCKHCLKISETMINLALSNINLFHFGAVNLENIKDGNDYLGIYANIKELPTLKIINEDNTLENYPFNYDIDNLIFYVNTNI
jgi:thiol-disulfide isomerase/thioredoxin